ncbi:hypothetical protein DL98DRAFT_537475 [Cadophora sp. DSE1049]|nr:hypothetical protein DL98DRAFT_537475 [Cadophora sp. DSE1049]
MSDDEENGVTVNEDIGSMSPTPKKFTRMACNRCHSHKLRCTRSTDRTSENCQRCIRANAICVYGMPMRLGRPRVSGSINETAASSTTTHGDDMGESSSSSNNSPHSIPKKTKTQVLGDVPPHDHGSPEYAATMWTAPTKWKLQDMNFHVVDTEAPISSWNLADHNTETDMMLDDREMMRPVGHALQSNQGSSQPFSRQGPHHLNTSILTGSAGYCGISLDQTFDRELSIFTNLSPWNVPDICPATATSNCLADSIDSLSPVILDSFDSTGWPFSDNCSRNMFSGRSLDDPLSSTNQFQDSANEEQPQLHTMNDCILELSELQLKLYRQSVDSLILAHGQQNRVVDVHGSATLVTATHPLAAPDFHNPAASDSQANSIFQTAQTFINILKRLVIHAPQSAPSNTAEQIDISRLALPPTNLGAAAGDSSSTNKQSPSAGQYNATFFLVLTCYLRLLNVTQPFVADLHVRLLQSANMKSIPANADLPTLRLGDFTPPASSELQIMLLVNVTQHLLDRVDKGIMACFPTELTMDVDQAASGQRCQEEEEEGEDRSRRIRLIANQFTLREIKLREEMTISVSTPLEEYEAVVCLADG